MNLLGFLDRPTSGRYRLNGTDVGRAFVRRDGVGPQPRHRLRLPELQPAGPHHVPRERGVAGPLQRNVVVGGPPQGAGDARAGGTQRAGSAPAHPVVRWPATAGGHRPGASQRSPPDPGRRAHRQPRYPHRRGDHRAFQDAQPGEGHHDRVRDPRSRGGLPRAAHRSLQGRPRGTGGGRGRRRAGRFRIIFGGRRRRLGRGGSSPAASTTTAPATASPTATATGEATAMAAEDLAAGAWAPVSGPMSASRYGPYG